jgi:hypothetical protein
MRTAWFRSVVFRRQPPVISGQDIERVTASAGFALCLSQEGSGKIGRVGCSFTRCQARWYHGFVKGPPEHSLAAGLSHWLPGEQSDEVDSISKGVSSDAQVEFVNFDAVALTTDR